MHAATLRSTRPSPAEPTRRTLLPVELLRLVDEVASAEALWSPFVSHDPDERSTLRLIATDVYEVWLLGWTPGQRVDLHDHGPSHAAFRVVEGTLTEIEPGRHGLHRRALAAGSSRMVACGTVHDVVNESPRPATSLHAYSPPLSAMTFYDSTATRPLRSERVEPTVPVWPGLGDWPTR